MLPMVTILTLDVGDGLDYGGSRDEGKILTSFWEVNQTLRHISETLGQLYVTTDAKKNHLIDCEIDL